MNTILLTADTMRDASRLGDFSDVVSAVNVGMIIGYFLVPTFIGMYIVYRVARRLKQRKLEKQRLEQEKARQLQMKAQAARMNQIYGIPNYNQANGVIGSPSVTNNMNTDINMNGNMGGNMGMVEPTGEEFVETEHIPITYINEQNNYLLFL